MDTSTEGSGPSSGDYEKLKVAVNSDDPKQLQTFLDKWVEDASSNDIESILSKVCNELKLNITPISDDSEVLLENKLLQSRFFTANSNDNIELTDITDRIKLVSELIDSLLISYLENDEIFIFILTCISKQIFILKRLLKSTYNRLPWEEIEFCLISFVHSNIKAHELNIFYKHILKKPRIIRYLKIFSAQLSKVGEDIQNIPLTELSKFPHLKRDDAIQMIIENCKEFEDIYKDHEYIRDVHSLSVISEYVKLVSLVAQKKSRKLVMIRTLQVIGEHLKNTLESPKLSPSLGDLLLLSVQENTKEILLYFRDYASHTQYLCKSLELQDQNFEFFVDIKSDIENLDRSIEDLLSKRTIQVTKSIARKFVETANTEATKEVAIIFKGLDVSSMIKFPSKKNNKELDNLKMLIERLRNIFVEKSLFTEKCFERIVELLQLKPVIEKDMGYLTVFAGLFDFQGKIDIFGEHYNFNKTNHMDDLKIGMKNVLESSPSEEKLNNFREISDMLSYVKMQALLVDNPKVNEVNSLIDEILRISKFQIDSIKWAENVLNQTYDESYILKTDYDDKTKQYCSSSDKLTSKLSELAGVFANTKQIITFSEFKRNKELQAEVEVLILDVLLLMNHRDKCSMKNEVFFFDNEFPLLIGNNLRDYLIHNNVIFEVLLNPIMAIFLNGKKLIGEMEMDLKQDLGKYSKYNYSALNSLYNENINNVILKQSLFAALKAGNFETFKDLVSKGADIRARGTDMSTCLHFAAEKCTVECIKYLIIQGLNPTTKNIESQTPFHIAAKNGNAPVVRFLLMNQYVSNIDDLDNHNRSCLHLAAYNGHKDVIQFLIDHKADLTMKDRVGFIPLYYAILSKKIDVVELFFSYNTYTNVPVSNQTTGGLSMLQIAAEDGSLDIVEFLLSKNIPVDEKNDMGGTALHLTAFNGHLEVLNVLIRNGANVNISAVNGSTALHCAAKKSHELIIESLLKHGAKVDVPEHENNFAPLHYAAKYGHDKAVETLLRNNANVNIVSIGGFTPLHLAVAGGHKKVVDLLLCYDIDVNAKNVMQFTALHLAAITGDFEITKLLLLNGAEINSNNESPLHLAAREGHEHIVYFLLGKGASITAKSSDGSLPLHAAVESGKKSIIGEIMKKTSDVNARTFDGSNCLHIAARFGRNVIEFLVQSGLRINTRTLDSEFTPLHEAVSKNHPDIVKSLIKCGADINLKDNSGKSALILAIEGGCKDIIQILIDTGADINLENEPGSTAFLSAVTRGHQEIVDILLTRNRNHDLILDLISRGLLMAADIRILSMLLARYPECISKKIYEDGSTLLHMAVAFNRLDFVEMFLQNGAKTDAETIQGRTALSTSIECASGKIVRRLITSGADVNSTDQDGITPLHRASKSGRYEIVQILLDSGAKVHVPDKENRLAIEFAAAAGHLQIFRMLLEHEEFDINHKGNDDYTMLHIASQNGHLELVEYLIQKGADINTKNSMNSKPIHLAAREGFSDILETFLNKGMSINDLGGGNNTLLHFAAIEGRVKVIKYLLTHGLKVDAVNIDGKTSLHKACEYSQRGVVEKLLNSGAIYNIPDTFGKTPMYYVKDETIRNILSSVDNLFSLIKLQKLSEIKSLPKKRIVLNAKDIERGSALHFAVYKGHTGIVEFLLENKACPNLAFKNGWTALHYAAKFSNIDILKLLLSYGAKYNATSDTGKTPKDFSTDDDIRRLLNLIDESFRNVREGNTNIVKRLKKIKDIATIKAIMNAQNIDGATLVTFAIKNNFQEIEKLKGIAEGDFSEILDLADALLMHEKYQEALEIFEKVYQQRVALLGVDNPGTLDIKQKIAIIFYKKQNYQKALKMYEEIYKKQVEILGSDNECTLKSRGKIGLIFHRQGRMREALPILTEVLEKQKKLLKPDHEDLLATQADTAIVLHALGKLEEALNMNYQSLEIRKKYFKPQHIGALVIKNNIAMILADLERYDEAIQMYDEVYKARVSLLGPHNSDTMRCLHNKIGILTQQKKYDDALLNYKKLYEDQVQYLGLKHLDTLNTGFNMGSILFKQGKYYSAYEMLRENKKNRQSILGREHNDMKAIEAIMESIRTFFRVTGIHGDLDSFIDNIQYHLTTAARRGDLKVVENLMESGVEVNRKDAAGLTPLHFAVDGGNLQVINLVLKNGGDVTSVTHKGNTTLHTACSKGSIEVVELLVKQVSADKIYKYINVQTNGGKTTALHVAAKKGNFEIVKMLLKHGAIFNIKNRESKTPLDLSNDESVSNILKLIAKLFEAVQKGRFNFGMIERLEPEEFKCVINAHNVDNFTLLKFLVSRGNAEAARVLLQKMKLDE